MKALPTCERKPIFAILFQAYTASGIFFSRTWNFLEPTRGRNGGSQVRTKSSERNLSARVEGKIRERLGLSLPPFAHEMSMPTIHESGIHKGHSPDQATVRPVEKPVSPRGSEPGTTTRPEPSSELSSLPPSSSSIEPRSSSPVKVTQEGRGNAGQGFINSDHSTPTAPVQPTPVPIEPIQERPAAVKTDTNMHRKSYLSTRMSRLSVAFSGLRTFPPCLTLPHHRAD